MTATIHHLPKPSFAEAHDKGVLARYSMVPDRYGKPGQLQLERLKDSGEMAPAALKSAFIDEARAEYDRLPPRDRDHIYDGPGARRGQVKLTKDGHNRRVLSAGITVGHRDEDGFRPTGRFSAAAYGRGKLDGHPLHRPQPQWADRLDMRG
jgi:hypothetical protein